MTMMMMITLDEKKRCEEYLIHIHRHTEHAGPRRDCSLDQRTAGLVYFQISFWEGRHANYFLYGAPRKRKLGSQFHEVAQTV